MKRTFWVIFSDLFQIVKIVICFNNETFEWSRDGYIGVPA